MAASKHTSKLAKEDAADSKQSSKRPSPKRPSPGDGEPAEGESPPKKPKTKSGAPTKQPASTPAEAASSSGRVTRNQNKDPGATSKATGTSRGGKAATKHENKVTKTANSGRTTRSAGKAPASNASTKTGKTAGKGKAPKPAASTSSGTKTGKGTKNRATGGAGNPGDPSSNEDEDERDKKDKKDKEGLPKESAKKQGKKPAKPDDHNDGDDDNNNNDPDNGGKSKQDPKPRQRENDGPNRTQLIAGCEERGLKTSGTVARLKNRLAWYGRHGWLRLGTPMLKRMCRRRGLTEKGELEDLLFRIAHYEYRGGRFWPFTALKDKEIDPSWRLKYDEDVVEESDGEELDVPELGTDPSDKGAQHPGEPAGGVNDATDAQDGQDQPAVTTGNYTSKPSEHAPVAAGGGGPPGDDDPDGEGNGDNGDPDKPRKPSPKLPVDKDGSAAAVPESQATSNNKWVSDLAPFQRLPAQDGDEIGYHLPPMTQSEARYVKKLYSDNQTERLQTLLIPYSEVPYLVQDVQDTGNQVFQLGLAQGTGNNCFWYAVAAAINGRVRASWAQGRECKRNAVRMWHNVMQPPRPTRACVQRKALYKRLEVGMPRNGPTIERQLELTDEGGLGQGVFTDSEMIQLIADWYSVQVILFRARLRKDSVDAFFRPELYFELERMRGVTGHRQIFLVHWLPYDHYSFLLPVDLTTVTGGIFVKSKNGTRHLYNTYKPTKFNYDKHTDPEVWLGRIPARDQDSLHQGPLPAPLDTTVRANGGLHASPVATTPERQNLRAQWTRAQVMNAEEPVRKARERRLWEEQEKKGR